MLDDLIEFGMLSNKDFRKLAMHIRSFEQSDRATAAMGVVREADDEIVTQLSPKIRLRK